MKGNCVLPDLDVLEVLCHDYVKILKLLRFWLN